MGLVVPRAEEAIVCSMAAMPPRPPARTPHALAPPEPAAPKLPGPCHRPGRGAPRAAPLGAAPPAGRGRYTGRVKTAQSIVATGIVSPSEAPCIAGGQASGRQAEQKEGFRPGFVPVEHVGVRVSARARSVASDLYSAKGLQRPGRLRNCEGKALIGVHELLLIFSDIPEATHH